MSLSGEKTENASVCHKLGNFGMTIQRVYLLLIKDYLMMMRIGKTYLIKNNISLFKHALILNCGNGWMERELYDTGIILKATAVEYNTDLVEECNKMKGAREITYVQHDINTVEFDENTFDLVINFAACNQY